MDNDLFDEKLRQLLECVEKEVNNEVLDRILFKMEGFSTEKSPYGTRNVATMTDSVVVTTSSGTNNPGNTENVMIAEKQNNRKRNAEERREIQLANKMYKPGECMKHMTVELHPSLAGAWFAADVERELGAAGARLRLVPDCEPELVRWSRAAPPSLVAADGMLQLATAERSERALYVATAEDAAALVAERALSRRLGLAARLTGCRLTLLLFGVQEYFKASGRKKKSNHQPLMTEVELEMALTDLLVTAGCDAVRAETPAELALAVLHLTRAVAEAPHKKARRQCEEQAQFYMRGDSKNCVAVNKDGVGAAKLWQQMLAVLPMSSLERARALCALYTCPKRLYQELSTPGGAARVADVGVARAAVPGCVARRTGDEFARKLAILFTADDGDTVLQ